MNRRVRTGHMRSPGHARTLDVGVDVRRAVRRISAVFFLYAQHALEYKSRSFVWFLLVLIESLVYLLFWRGALGGSAQPVWSVREAVSYYLLLLVASSFLQVHIEEEMAFEDIQYGRLSQYLLRPFPYIWFKFFQELPWRIIQGAFGLLTIAGLSAWVVRIDVIRTAEHLPLVVFIVLSAYFLCFVYKMIVGTLAFWTIDFSGVNNIQIILYMLLSGVFMPLHLLPDGFRSFALEQPLAYMLYYPVRSVQGVLGSGEMERILLMQWVWIALGLFIFRVLWRRGLKEFVSVGQ